MKIKNDYEIYSEKQKELATLIREYADIMEQLGFENESAEAKNDSEKVESQNFEVAVVGSFKNGKSTFINALLGKEILPAYARPCTAIINEIRYAKKESAKLFLKEELSEDQLSILPDWIKREIKKNNVLNGISIPMEHLKDVLTIPIGESQEDFETPYSKLVLYYPLELLKNLVAITDTPGLNEMENRTRITTEHLQKADAIIMVFSADKLCSQVEMKFVKEDLQKNGFVDPFFIINRMDTVKKEKDVKEIKELAVTKLSQYTEKSQDSIFFISAVDALDGKIEKDDELIKTSNFIAVEQALSDYLIHERGKDKLSGPSKKMASRINDYVLGEIIPKRQKGLTTNKQEAIINQAMAEKNLKNAEVYQKNIISTIDNNTNIYLDDLTKNVDAFYFELKNKIGLWVDNYKLKNNEEINPKKRAEIVQREILNFLSEKIKVYTDDWHIEYKKMVNQKIFHLEGLIKRDLDEFENELKNSQIEFFGEDCLQSDESNGVLNNSTDAVNILSSELMTNIGKSVVVAAGAGIAIELLTGLMNPLLGIITAIGSVAFGAFKGTLKAEANIKENIKAKMVESIENESKKGKKKINQSTKKLFETHNNEIKKALNSRYEQAKKVIDDTVDTLKKGKTEIETELKMLDECKSKLINLYQRIESFIGEL